MQPVDIRPDHLAIVLGILAQHVPEAEVWVFGSRAKWLARDTSDLDLCIRAAAPIGFARMGALREAFEESNLPYKVDVVDWANTSESFRKIIERDKVVVRAGGRGGADEWEDLTLGDLGRIVTGKTPLTTVEGNFGGEIPFVTSSDMDGRRTISTTARYLTEAGAASVKGSKIPADSVMVSCIGSDMGKAVIAGRDCVTNQQINSIIVDERFSSEFVYYNLSTRKNEIRHQAAGGSAQPILNKGDFSRLEITLPPLPEQKVIAQILGTLDEKIELNQRMNATLEVMARALFQSWFVDFDPVRAKLDCRQPAGLNAATAALFSDHFEETVLGHTPQGWEVRNLDKIAHYLNGLALQKFPPGDGPTLPVIKIAQLRKGDTAGADRCNIDLPPDYVVQDGDVLFSWSGSLEVELWGGGTGVLNQHLFKVTSAEFPKWFYYLWTLYHLDEFRLIAAGKATTMGHIQRGHLAAAKVLVPPRPMLDAMTRTISPIIAQIIANRTQSRTIATLRDALLPKILSGELSVAKIALEPEEV